MIFNKNFKSRFTNSIFHKKINFSSKIRFLNKNGIVQKQSIFGAKIRFFHFFQSMKKHRKSQNSITPQKSVTTPLDPLSRPLPRKSDNTPHKIEGRGIGFPLYACRRRSCGCFIPLRSLISVKMEYLCWIFSFGLF